MSEPFRLAFVNSHPIQYFAPLFAYLNRDPELDVTALYCSDFSLRGAVDPGFKQPVTWDVDLLDGYTPVFLGEAARTRTLGGFWSLICPEIWGQIRRERYDAVCIHGYHFAAFVLAFLAAKSIGTPVFVRSETHLGLQRQGWRRRLRDGVLTQAYRFVDAFLAIGTGNRDYYRSLGVPASKIFDVPYTVDNERMILSAQLTSDERLAIRERFGLPPSGPVILYASKFMPRKHPDDVVRAVAKLRDDGIDSTLLLVGTGELEGHLRELVEDLSLQERVRFGGFVNQAELPRVFSACDVFVLPSENEPWGLIVNEAMCASLPVVVSREVGCVQDIVVEGSNGLLTDAGDVGTIASALRNVLADPGRAVAMGKKSLEIIRGWDYERCRVGITSAARSTRH